jgi:choline kinase
MLSFVQQAIVLAAGNGDRFRGESARSKLLTPVGGIPLLVRTLRSARLAGITDAHVVLGYDADRVRQLASTGAPAGLTVHFHINPDWHRENGVSVLATRRVLTDQAFAILMGDHLFDPNALKTLLHSRRAPGEVLLGIDRHTTDTDVVTEATKVRIQHGRISAIGKDVTPFDALDTGLFVCDGAIFNALDASCRAGDTTLSGGVRRLAAEDNVRGCDIGNSRWCDIDTVADLQAAEGIVSLATAS